MEGGGMTDTPRAAGYCRVSTEEQAAGFSLGEQERKLRERAKADGAELVACFTDKVSGARSDRANYQRLLAAAAAGELDVVYVWKLDRLGRDAEELLRARRMLGAAGVRLVSTTEGEDESTLVFGVRALVAQEEREKISERTRVGKAAAARAGRANGGPRRYGFDQVDGRLIPRPDEMAVVERVLREAVAGHSQTEIAFDLNADGHRTATGKRWNQTRISQMLANPIWGGVLRNAQGVHRIAEPFLPVELVEAAQRTLRGPEGPRRGRRSQHFLLGNGLLRCGQCDSPMIVRRDQKDWGWYEVYLCGGRSSGATTCKQRAVQRAAIDGAVLAYFERVGLDVEATRAELAERSDRERAELAALRGQAERELAKAEERLERVRRAFQDGIIEPDDWAEQREQLQAELTAAQEGAARMTARAAEASEDASVLDDIEILSRLTELRSAIAGNVTSNPDDFAATHAALGRLFEAFQLRAIHGLHGVPVDLWDTCITEDVPAPAGYVLVPVPRSDAVVVRDGKIVVQPVPLSLNGPANADGGVNGSPP
jgi:site-specific DNA recombinase